MPTLWIELPEPALALETQRRKWTRAECEALESIGLLTDERLELVEGELIRMSKKRPHSDSQRRLFRWLLAIFGVDFIIEDEPIDVRHEDNQVNEPVPDITILNRSFEEFSGHNPGPADVSLIVEVSSSSLYLDLKTKSAVYARAGIADYWVLDVAGRTLIVHRKPESGAYREIVGYAENEYVSPLAAPAAKFKVGDAFPG
jgi:Uma2 family endonuclease